MGNAETLSPSVRCRPRERGAILLWAVLAVIVIAGFIAVGSQEDVAMDALATYQVEAPAQARAVAEAGIVDAYAWFRRQTVQPVTGFAPQRDLAQDPPINETDDPTIGLVREYEIASDLWARYEVRTMLPAEPFSDLNGNGLYDEGETFTDVDGSGKWEPTRETQDISTERGQAGAGAIWLLVSHGMVYERRDPYVELGTDPNRRLAVARVATEIRRMALTAPAESAICISRGDQIAVGNRSRITGNQGAGIVYASATGSPVIGAGAELTGAPSTSAVPNYDGSIEAVFGVGLSELKSMSDVSTSDHKTLGAPLGEFTLVVVDGDAKFDFQRPLRGTGIVVVLGNCTLVSGSNSFFNGLLWVGGDLEIRAPAYIRGTIIANGAVDIRGVGGDHAEVNFDDGIITELLAMLGQYRHTKTIYPFDQDALPQGMRTAP